MGCAKRDWCVRDAIGWLGSRLVVIRPIGCARPRWSAPKCTALREASLPTLCIGVATAHHVPSISLATLPHQLHKSFHRHRTNHSQSTTTLFSSLDGWLAADSIETAIGGGTSAATTGGGAAYAAIGVLTGVASGIWSKRVCRGAESFLPLLRRQQMSTRENVVASARVEIRWAEREVAIS